MEPEKWDSPQKILVILAHPDDPEFFCGATLARWSAQGHEVNYCLLTKGDKGGSEKYPDSEQLAKLRVKEQKEAASVIGVKEVIFLDFKDGTLFSGLEERKAVVRVIRQIKPNIVVTCDPTSLFFRENYLNHPDHLAAGLIVSGAVYPAAGNRLYFPELLNENLLPHEVQEVWFSLAQKPNTIIDVTDYWNIKVNALQKHQSQVGEWDEFEEHIRNRFAEGTSRAAPRYEEKFYRVNYR